MSYDDPIPELRLGHMLKMVQQERERTKAVEAQLRIVKKDLEEAQEVARLLLPDEGCPGVLKVTIGEKYPWLLEGSTS